MGIELKKLRFQRDGPLFDGLDFAFATGAMTVLTGDSGSGKSTLLNLIAGFAPMMYEGKILVNGHDNRDDAMQSKARQVGMLFQNPDQQFTMRTLRGELNFALENLNLPAEAMVKQIRQAVALGETTAFLDRDLQTLSGGEKQRAALTVLLAMDAPVLLLDEPFASIDPASRQQLITKLGHLRDVGKTIVIAEHDLSDYADVADELVSLKNGRLTRLPLSTLTTIPTHFQLTQTNAGTKPLFHLDHVICGQNRQVLIRAADWHFNTGITTLTGANGSGKSTLLRAMVQLHPYQGRMLLGDRRLRRRQRLFQTMTLAVQDATKQFVTLTPADELKFGSPLTAEVRERQQNALEYLGLADKQNGSLYHLSDGQKKMIQLIAMLSLDRSFLLLDEPFSGLDERACAFFTKWIQEKAVEESFLIVTHRLAPLAGVSQQHVQLADQHLQVVGG
ncbi:cobalt ABC transporter ATP-binding protein [Lacticaseibacillus chiayiensis]|uniref:ABC transporter ATP-binding protein n=1 Tax=Lacticaseibacillus chiayiensis TaxID=2100821 RepID=A0A4Q1U7P3_9LACO|nr:ABC transporter ATP-binding protein [Lacticaseibacillus chiayiensis]QVI35017.1 ABC transporter ATP-binding protein [Lacticaseibacillus chiayiensis]RXT27055.1 cobalt ABC transporter ATP-binding protein [Lacticaseibacillus chiayiensis]UYN56798.1 ABC transporter ATP-binding protein [Lacticaseibacillus chiayiensis]